MIGKFELGGKARLREALFKKTRLDRLFFLIPFVIWGVVLSLFVSTSVTEITSLSSQQSTLRDEIVLIIQVCFIAYAIRKKPHWQVIELREPLHVQGFFRNLRLFVVRNQITLESRIPIALSFLAIAVSLDYLIFHGLSLRPGVFRSALASYALMVAVGLLSGGMWQICWSKLLAEAKFKVSGERLRSSYRFSEYGLSLLGILGSIMLALWILRDEFVVLYLPAFGAGILAKMIADSLRRRASFRHLKALWIDPPLAPKSPGEEKNKSVESDPTMKL